MTNVALARQQHRCSPSRVLLTEQEILRHRCPVPEFIRPHHEGLCFDRIPVTVLALFKGNEPDMLSRTELPRLAREALPERCDHVVLLFVDALGMRALTDLACGAPRVERALAAGRGATLTSQFPSATTAHLTTIHTGLRVLDHGLYDWDSYQPKRNQVVSPLPNTIAGEEGRETLPAHQISYPTPYFYRALRDLRVQSHIFQSSDYTPSTFSTAMAGGIATLHPSDSVRHAFSQCRDQLLLNEPGERSYSLIYVSDYDAMAHRVGPNDRRAQATAISILGEIERFLEYQMPPNTLVLLTADHGQVRGAEKSPLVISDEIPGLDREFMLDRAGRPLRWSGGPRAMNLHVHGDRAQCVAMQLRQKLGERAWVITRGEAASAGLFGTNLHDEVTTMGSVIVLPRDNRVAVWHRGEAERLDHRGFHGGLTEDEVLIPFLVVRSE